MIGINVGRRVGTLKDTAANIEAMREFVVSIADDTMMENVHRSALEFPPEVSEVEVLGLELAPTDRVDVPRLAAAPISMECRVHQILTFGEKGAQFIVGEVLLSTCATDSARTTR